MIPGSGRSPGEGKGYPLQCPGWRIPWTVQSGPLGKRVGHERAPLASLPPSWPLLAFSFPVLLLRPPLPRGSQPLILGAPAAQHHLPGHTEALPLVPSADRRPRCPSASWVSLGASAEAPDGPHPPPHSSCGESKGSGAQTLEPSTAWLWKRPGGWVWGAEARAEEEEKSPAGLWGRRPACPRRWAEHRPKEAALGRKCGPHV